MANARGGSRRKRAESLLTNDAYRLPTGNSVGFSPDLRMPTAGAKADLILGFDTAGREIGLVGSEWVFAPRSATC